MHSLALLSLFACVLSAALASAILARGARDRAHRLMAAILGFVSAWALIDLVASTVDERDAALAALRAASFATLPLGPLCLDLLLELRPRLRATYARLLPVMYVLTPFIAITSMNTAWFVTDAVPTSWGWSPIHGPGFGLALLLTIGPPAIALISMLRAHFADDPELRPVDVVGLAVAIALPPVVVVAIDVVYAAFGHTAPRLGPLSVALVSGTLWLRSLHRGYVIAPINTTAREILDRLSHGVAVISRDGHFRAVNRSLARLLRCDSGALHTLELSELLPDSPEELWGGLEERETMLRIQGRTMIPVSISTALTRDPRGAVSGLVLTLKDQRQVVELRRRLVTSGRLAAVGELAAGIAHEVNNPIAYIQANLNLLSQHREDLEAHLSKSASKSASESTQEGESREAIGIVREGVEAALEEIGRVASVVRDVVDFAHLGSGGQRLHDVNALLDAAIRLASLQRGLELEVERSYGEVEPVLCIEQDVKHVFVSILLGATETSPECPLYVETSSDGRVVSVRIEDECWVVTPQLVERDFDPAVDADRSDGVGFSLAYQIVRQLGGSLSIERRDEGGTRVVVRLPIPELFDEPETSGLAAVPT